jgi:hypothetical protein
MFRSEFVRYLIAGTFAICGAGIVICANRADFLRNIVRSSDSASKWEAATSAFGVGILTLFAVTCALVLDAIVRNIFKLFAHNLHFSLRALLIAFTISAIFFALFGAIIR